MDAKNPYLLHISIGNPTSSFRNKRFNTHYFTSCYQASVRLEDSSSTAHSCSFSVCHGIGEVVRLWLWQIFWVHNQIPDRIHISVYVLCDPAHISLSSCHLSLSLLLSSCHLSFCCIISSYYRSPSTSRRGVYIIRFKVNIPSPDCCSSRFRYLFVPFWIVYIFT